MRDALGVGSGDIIGYEIKDGVVIMRAMAPDDGLPDNPFALFTEWADEHDAVFDNL